MKTKFTILVSIMASSLSFPGAAYSQSTFHPYWPLTNGSWIQYDVYDITSATFNQSDGRLNIVSVAPHGNSPQTLSVSMMTCDRLGPGPIHKVQ